MGDFTRIGSGELKKGPVVSNASESYAKQGLYRLKCERCGKMGYYEGFLASAPRYHQAGLSVGKWLPCGPLRLFAVLEDRTRPRKAEEEDEDDD
jgi:hypothetical protein